MHISILRFWLGFSGFARAFGASELPGFSSFVASWLRKTPRKLEKTRGFRRGRACEAAVRSNPWLRGAFEATVRSKASFSRPLYARKHRSRVPSRPLGVPSRPLGARKHCLMVPSRLLFARKRCSRGSSRPLCARRPCSRVFAATVRSKSSFGVVSVSPCFCVSVRGC